MSAYPSIVASTGYVYDSHTMVLMCLYENKASMGYTSGMVKFQGAKYDIPSSVCYVDESPSDIDVHCAKTTAYNLKNIAKPIVYGQGIFNYGCIQSFGCSSGDNCAGRICTAWGAAISFIPDIPIVARNTSYPLAPTGLTITPGSGALAIGWNSVNDPVGGEVFAYHVLVYDGSNPVIDGYTEAGLRTVTIGGLTNGKAYSVQVWAVNNNGYESLSAAMGSGTPAGGAPSPKIFSTCWGTTITSPCGNSPSMPPIPPGTNFKIMADIYNDGSTGKVKAVFKIDGAVIKTLENASLQQCSGNSCMTVQWYPTVNYTMPNKNVTLTIETYGWDGTKWVAASSSTVTYTISASTPTCVTAGIGFYLDPVKVGDKVSIPVNVTPTTQPFTVKIKLRDGTVMGQCVTSNGSCTILWDTAGKTSGAYYFKASVEGQCTSEEKSISLSPAINQWNVNIYAKDAVTNVSVGGATVTAGTQIKQTDAAGYVQFRVTEGTINIAISKTGYNTFTTSEYVFSDKTLNYPLSPVGIATGNIQFVSVPSNAEIFIDDVDQGLKTPVTIIDLPVGIHTFALKLQGFNDTAGSVTVVGGITIPVYAELSPSTPNTGSLYIASFPGDAEIFIDGADQGVKTPTTITNLPPGSHTVKLAKTGYADFTGQATITAGTTVYLSATLTILPGIGTLEISSTPPKARVFVDGADTQRETSATITNLTSGDHIYKLVLSEYQEATGTFTIESGQTKTVSVLMAKTAEGIGAGTKIVLGLVGVGALAAIISAASEPEWKPNGELPRLKQRL